MTSNPASTVSMSASLKDLIWGLVDVETLSLPELAVPVTGIQIDSRKLAPGDLFIAYFGHNHDARDYIPAALDHEVSAVLAESGGEWQGVQIVRGKPVIAVDNLTVKISEVAARFYGRPSNSLTVFGVTGTNGKTSCSQFMAQVLRAVGKNCGVIGTLGYGPFDDLLATDLTTPDAVFTQMALAEMSQRGIDLVAMEASSVGLHQKRVAAVNFNTAIFTNLSRDHLDYHECMESYAENKRQLFTMPGLRRAVINLDDQFALSFIDAVSSDVQVWTYSACNQSASVYAKNVTLGRNGFAADLVTPIGEAKLEAELLGHFNFSNVLAVVTTMIGYLEVDSQASLQALCDEVSRLKPVTGRMEIVGNSDVTAVVDYAHTPDGLRSALRALRDHFDGAIWCVFGCGGNRDKGKRPMMGEIAEQYADHIILTDDNPRNESGEGIVEHIQSGMLEPNRCTIIRDRASAIEAAINEAESGDVVLVAGKGHETYQESNGVRLLFSDKNQLRIALQTRTWSPRGQKH
ncbi:MAG: UDP-N-acetylmuramoyl-L-alanyl-D-glutamate--2,6-diaminopimelate ligase [Gammaproteobacteria bacterium]|nr:UDP-N-acetylmuramoyl-L-alanyl-D-glutamate--2,6-diaminopimelate ligase [Gammaproteobacteria bacterium]HBW82623.1 UDP-N-acetylmuramoyl-L-alanyl-D-glutamate--2,6-diaminopimelate ligase [Gammaproteobacteria bacterium]|tara:strand:- start:893 stop:2446 length:1554 start_codon:yes stop_codon:yes gene_type:complete